MEGQVNYIEKKDKKEPTLLLAHKGASEGKNTQYLNTRASNHVYGFKNIFMELDESKSDHVTLEDASKIPVKGKS